MNLNAAQGGKPTHSTMTKDRPAKVPPMDPDLGDDNKGRWRASLAESGKVCTMRQAHCIVVSAAVVGGFVTYDAVAPCRRSEVFTEVRRGLLCGPTLVSSWYEALVFSYVLCGQCLL